ncbi:MAG: Clp protease N-terminal domain-containing protein [Planctomycetaceae bacterium]
MPWFLVLAGCLLGAALSGADGSLLLGVLIGGAIGRVIALFVQLGRREGRKIVEAYQSRFKPKIAKTALQTERFTERALQVLKRAKQAASGWHHDYLATEHLLIGLLESRAGTLQAVMHDLFLPDTETLRGEIEQALEPARGGFSLEAPLSQTPRFRRTLKRAATWAADSGNGRVDAEHLFCALLEEDDGIAARVLRGYTPDFDEARRLILDHLRQELLREQPA